jgi:hypothetical protein
MQHSAVTNLILDRVNDAGGLSRWERSRHQRIIEAGSVHLVKALQPLINSLPDA